MSKQILREDGPENIFLWSQIKALPFFRALLRSVEASYYQEIELPRPIYDVGCGDGHFASDAFDFKLDVGLDPWETPIQEAKDFGAYKGLVLADGAKAPFPKAHFSSAVSNSVLEHIVHLQDVLDDTARVLKSGAPFIFCVPNPDYYTKLSIPAFLRKIGLKALAEKYVNWFGIISRMENADWPEVWEDRLEKAGFELESYWHYFPPKSLRMLEWGHFFGFPSLIAKKIFGRWIIAPARWNLALTAWMLRPFASTACIENGTYTFFIARKK